MASEDEVVAEDKTYVAVMPDGTKHVLDVDDLDRFEWRDIKNVLGMTQTQVLVALATFDLDTIAAVLWCVRKREEPDLVFEQVNIRMRDIHELADDDEDTSDPPD